MAALVSNVDNGSAYVGVDYIWEISLTSSQISCISKLALKKLKSLTKRKCIFEWGK